jgi:hypothetical protein
MFLFNVLIIMLMHFYYYVYCLFLLDVLLRTLINEEMHEEMYSFKAVIRTEGVIGWRNCYCRSILIDGS